MRITAEAPPDAAWRSEAVGVIEDQTILVAVQKAGEFFDAPGDIGTSLRNADEARAPVGSSRECEGCGQRKRWI